MFETKGQFKVVCGLLWLDVGILLVAAALISAVYIIVHLIK